MIASADTSSRLLSERLRAGAVRAGAGLALGAVLIVSIGVHSADAARKRRARSFYAPPQAAMVVDAYTGKVLHAHNPDEPRYPASVTKVMTLYLLFEELKAGKIAMDTQFRVTAHAAGQSPSKLGLSPGSSIAVRDAIYALVTKSANDCAVVVAENLAGSEDDFARAMTTKARALGMTNTTFRNASGLPNSEQRTTARDLITLGKRVLADFPEYASVFSTRVFTYNGESYRNHNGLLFTYAGTEGLKTGFTVASGFNLLTSVRRDNKHLLAVVLGGRSAGERNARMRSLLNANWKGATGGSRALLAKAWSRQPDAAPRLRDTEAAELEIASADFEVPERNPAFHATDSQRAITLAMATMLELDRRQTDAAPPAPVIAPASAPAPAVDAASPQPQPETPASAALASAVEGEDAAREEMISAAEEMNDEGQGDRAEEDVALAAKPAPVAPQPVLGPYHIQVGSYASEIGARAWLEKVSGKAKGVIKGHDDLTVQGEVAGQPRYRARFGQFSEKEAKSACGKLKALSIDCMIIRVE
jgi:D-alanyl-D-alanine carboxypeptidase